MFTPPAPGAAISRGAVVYGLNPSIFAARYARRTYGSEALAMWSPMRDPDHLRVEYGGREMVKTIVPFVYKGQLIETTSWICRDFVPINAADRSISVGLYSTEKDKGRYPTDAGMQRIGELRVDVPEGLGDKIIVVEMNYSGPVIQVRAFPKLKPDMKANVTINLGPDHK